MKEFKEDPNAPMHLACPVYIEFSPIRYREFSASCGKMRSIILLAIPSKKEQGF